MTQRSVLFVVNVGALVLALGAATLAVVKGLWLLLAVNLAFVGFNAALAYINAPRRS